MDIKLGFDLFRDSDFASLQSLLADRRPRLFVCAPPCTSWSVLSNLTAHTHPEFRKRRDLERVRQRKLLKRMVALIELQQQDGRSWVVENPASSLLWQTPELLRLQQGTHFWGTMDQCQVGSRGSFVQTQHLPTTSLVGALTPLVVTSPSSGGTVKWPRPGRPNLLGASFEVSLSSFLTVKSASPQLYCHSLSVQRLRSFSLWMCIPLRRTSLLSKARLCMSWMPP